ncbi:MAG: hypothetical protein RLZZ381_737 [Cyanobacteriota bacterium]|jgi:hypothetical protein
MPTKLGARELVLPRIKEALATQITQCVTLIIGGKKKMLLFTSLNLERVVVSYLAHFDFFKKNTTKVSI